MLKIAQQFLKIIVLVTVFSSCNLFRTVFGGSSNKNGCPSNGKNVGAEKLLRGDKKIPKAPAYKLNKY